MPAERNPKNILVTGGAGFIGSALIRHLLQKVPEFEGHIVNLDALTYAGNLENLNSVAENPRYKFVHGDIRNAKLVEEVCGLHSIDTIIHLAAESHVDRSIHNPQAFLETNILGTFSLLEIVRKRPHIHFHHVSTDEVYGCLGDTGLFSEATPYHPNSPYSASKAASDHLVRAYAVTYNLSTCISNCSNNYGPYQFPEKLIPLMILNCLQGKSLPVYGKGHNVRDWLYVDDHAAALWLLLTSGRRGETYNIGGNAERRNMDIIHHILKLVAKMTDAPEDKLLQLITYVPDRPGHDYRYAIDSSKIHQELGWEPAHSFNKGLEETVAWYLNNREWSEHVQSGSYRQWIEKNYAQRG
ncbi:MAG: dTDP-glucose 4,6-dehydratase [Parachlamydiales bacterium]|jgi:dTDP-glucose 4,6-dehydratase